ncbi:Arm DNA-binding domain-containing protein [Butyricimonas paravirosa]
MQCIIITRVNISFFRYHSRETETGEAPLYCRLWHENKRKIFSIGFKVTRNKWNQNKQMATGKSVISPLYLSRYFAYYTQSVFPIPLTHYRASDLHIKIHNKLYNQNFQIFRRKNIKHIGLKRGVPKVILFQKTPPSLRATSFINRG